MSKLHMVNEFGQSLWLNYLRRSFIESGELREAMDAGVRGITSSPRIFEKAITHSADYDRLVRQLVGQGVPVKEIYLALVIDDIQRAADVLREVYTDTDGRDGYVTVELDPALAHDAINTVAETRHLLALINRPNAMVEIPATAAGISALETLSADGVHTNATHIFSIATYQRVAEAYLRGLEKYLETHSVWRQAPASVASVSLGPIDRAADALLVRHGRTDWQGKTGIAMAKNVYRHFLRLFSGPSWQKLAQKGGKVQRPKWTRTTPRSYKYPDTLYADALIGPDTIQTLSPATYHAFKDHGRPALTLPERLEEAEIHLDALAALDIDLERIAANLQIRSLVAYAAYHRDLISSVMKKRDNLENEWQLVETHLPKFKGTVDRAMSKLARDRVMCRIWAHDDTLWPPDHEEVACHLGWLHEIDAMQENVGRLGRFSESVHDDGFTLAALASPHDEVPVSLGRVYAQWQEPFIKRRPHLGLAILDTQRPAEMGSQLERLSLQQTLFLVAGRQPLEETNEEWAQRLYDHVADRLGAAVAGQHFVAITSPGSQLERIAWRNNFREVFLSDPHAHGGFAALGYPGLVPAILVGANVGTLLDRALAMACNSHGCNDPLRGNNVAALLGSTLSGLVEAGRHKVTVISAPAIACFGNWVAELLAKSSRGRLVPETGRPSGPPVAMDNERLFIYLRLAGDDSCDKTVEALKDAGLPVVVMHLQDMYDLGGMFFTWEMAAAVAGHQLQVNPFA